jgi:nucleoid-associated protein YgaU
VRTAFNAQISLLESNFPQFSQLLQAVRASGNADIDAALRLLGCNPPVIQATTGSVNAQNLGSGCEALIRARSDFNAAVRALNRVAPRTLTSLLAPSAGQIQRAAAQTLRAADCAQGGTTTQAQIQSAPVAQPVTAYTVVPGDTLSCIAQTLLGDANAYMTIVYANRPQIDNPDLIFRGQLLRIPVG